VTWQKKGNGLEYYVKHEGDCASYRVQNGDTVSITHAGFVAEDGAIKQFDGNIEDELFKVTIGEGRLIFGMEHGMLGQCLAETRVSAI
jgi:FKBP-type peptidyl-prolyl cis-trans isomerase (trigger factor)